MYTKNFVRPDGNPARPVAALLAVAFVVLSLSAYVKAQQNAPPAEKAATCDPKLGDKPGGCTQAKPDNRSTSPTPKPNVGQVANPCGPWGDMPPALHKKCMQPNGDLPDRTAKPPHGTRGTVTLIKGTDPAPNGADSVQSAPANRPAQKQLTTTGAASATQSANTTKPPKKKPTGGQSTNTGSLSTY